MKDTIEALKNIFINDKRKVLYIFCFLVLTLIFVFLFAELQVLLSIEPDNIFLYFRIWGIKDWLTIIVLSSLISLNLIFFVYSIIQKSFSIQSTSITFFGSLAAIFSGILATALCSSCLVVLFSLLGISFASGILLLKYRFWIFLISTALLLISLYFQSKRVIEKCNCK